MRNAFTPSTASARSAGVKSMRSSIGHALPIVRRRLRRERLRRRSPLARHVGLRHGPLLDRPHGLARDAVERVDERLLRELRDGFDRPAVDDEVHQDRRRRIVPVPDVVMDQLVVPDALAGLRVEAHEARAVEIVAVALAAPDVGERRLGRQIDVAELGVGRHRRPNAGVARALGRAVEPRLVAGLAAPRESCGTSRAACRYARRSRARRLSDSLRRRPHADLVRGADDDDVADRRARGELLPMLDLSLTSPRTPTMRSTMPFSPKPGTGRPVSGSSAARWNPGVTVNKRSLPAPSRPVRGAAAGGLARRAREALLAVVRPPDPQQLAALRVDRDDVARDAGLRVEHAVDHQRRRLVARFGPRAVVAGVEPPRDLELARVARVDLVERRIALRGEVAAVEPPLDVLRRRHRRRRAAAAGGGGGRRRRRLRAALGGRRASAHESGGEERQYDARRVRHGFPPDVFVHGYSTLGRLETRRESARERDR